MYLYLSVVQLAIIICNSVNSYLLYLYYLSVEQLSSVVIVLFIVLNLYPVSFLWPEFQILPLIALARLGK